MTNRKQSIEEFLESMNSFKRNMEFRGIDSPSSPRITPSQWGVIMLIVQRSEVSVKDVSQALHISSSAATQLVDGLVESGYVTRKEYAKDRRKVVLTLSKKTKTQVEKMKGRMVEKFLTMFELLTDKEFEQFFTLNKKITDSFLKKSLSKK